MTPPESIPVSTRPQEAVEYSLQRLFSSVGDVAAQRVLTSDFFTRTRWQDAGLATFLLDEFPDVGGAACSFVRLLPGVARTVKFVVHGAYIVVACPSGGWLLKPFKPGAPAYWIPQSPILRTLDAHGHITAERPASMVGLDASASELMVELKLPADWNLDWAFWRFSPDCSDIPIALERPLNLERQRYYLWGSKANMLPPAEVYSYLLHGHVYTDAFVWPRKWKFHSELDACGLYVALDGLELATGKTFYRLLKRQMLYSVITQQAEDGGWHQGEWTDLMESHYRLHNSAMHMLEAGLEETGDDVVRIALERAAAFIATRTDRTDIGLWFLHDSLEESAEAMEEMRRQTNTRWIASRTLGKSPTNKLILNTHLDAIVTLDRYREISGDNQYAAHIASARDAARTLLSLRPAEPLYRLLYWAIGLTLLPEAEAMRLSWPLRALKRLTWMYLTPQMHRFKRIFPRMVMPGGLIERHVTPLHHDINYHPVNVMDLARYWRRFPEESLADIVQDAIRAVTSGRLLQYWSEWEPRKFALVVWADALYHLCILSSAPTYRRNLAEALLAIEDAGLGLPPSLLGSDAEVVKKPAQRPCPSPADTHLRVANLSRDGYPEVLVVNPSDAAVALTWERNELDPLCWKDSDGHPLNGDLSPLVPARGWVLGSSAG